jgi:thiol-disulfide isomerase/thioredoxin
MDMRGIFQKPSFLIAIGMIVLLIIFAVYYFVVRSKPPIIKTASSDATNQAELMLFYVDWCPHCKTAKPIWEDLKAEYQNKTVNGYYILFTEINCTNESTEIEKLIKKYNIEGYPTIKLVKDGQIIDFDSKVTKETLTEFLNTAL